MTRYINLNDAKKEFKKDFYPKVEKGIGQKGLADFNGKTERGIVVLRHKAEYGTPDHMKAY
ncbi:hypothetical protein [Gottfriedia acidiceleris]|uniref:hypothetical protein n=1 Tax=Gottfriedia acidiceleris TaxID=371036 RepID=UPI002FFFC9A6